MNFDNFLTHFRILLEQAQVYIYIQNLTQKWTKSGLFFQNQGAFSDFRKRVGEASPHSPYLYI